MKQLDSFDHSEEHIEAVLNSLQEGLLEIAPDGTVLRVNNSLASLLEIDQEAARGRRSVDLLSRFRPLEGESLSVCEAIQKHSHCSGYCSLINLEGTERHFAWILSPLSYFGASQGSLLTILDCTEKNQIKTALMQEHEDFLAVLNHRLRTPVLAANRIISLILEGQFGTLTEKQEEVISLMQENMTEINRLMLMIMDIYRYRTNAKYLHLAEHKVSHIIKRAQASKLLSRAKIPIQVSVNCSKDELIVCDDKELITLISHLLENAIKYAQSKVSLTADCDGTNFTICVEDDGKGIPKSDLKDLFNRFYLVSTDGKYAPSTGAGLCLCAEIARSHGGDISCLSDAIHGTRFLLRLPVKQPANFRGD